MGETRSPTPPDEACRHGAVEVAQSNMVPLWAIAVLIAAVDTVEAMVVHGFCVFGDHSVADVSAGTDAMKESSSSTADILDAMASMNGDISTR